MTEEGSLHRGAYCTSQNLTKGTNEGNEMGRTYNQTRFEDSCSGPIPLSSSVAPLAKGNQRQMISGHGGSLQANGSMPPFKATGASSHCHLWRQGSKAIQEVVRRLPCKATVQAFGTSYFRTETAEERGGRRASRDLGYRESGEECFFLSQSR